MKTSMFGDYYHMMDGGQYWNDGMMFIGLIWIALAAFVVAYIIRGRNRSQDGNPPAPHKETPLDIAKARYAKGEINKEQFDQIKTDLVHR